MIAELRAATHDDVDAITAIERASFSDPWSAASFAGMLGGPRARVVVATEFGKVVGYSVLLLAPPDADLANLAVAASVRGRGYGRLLLDGVIADASAAGASHIYLEVRQSNARAIAMYQRAGFEQAGLRRRYYREPVEDAKVLRKTLASR